MTKQEVIKQLDKLVYQEYFLKDCLTMGELQHMQNIEALEFAKRVIEKSEPNTRESSINLSDEELSLINSYTRRKLTKDEVYAFSVVLCDNDIDRDGERFTVESLFALEKLFIGKTGIIDHNPSAKNQTARIFSCCVESIEGRKTLLGDDYFRLKARAYIVKDKCNESVIRLIHNGTLNEVSIGCGAHTVRCNICGKKKGECFHEKGKKYGYTVCRFDIMDIYDAYEWSLTSAAKTETVKITEVKHGEWKINSDGYYPYCSECKNEPKNGKLTNYCPNCGSMMRGDNDDS